MSPRGTSRQHGAFGRFHADDTDTGTFFLQAASNTHNRPAGTDSSNEHIHTTARLSHNFGAGPHVMGFGISRVGKLIGHEGIVTVFLRQLPGFIDRTFHSQGTGSQDNFRTEHAEQSPAFHRHGLRHDQQTPVPQATGNEGQPDSRIAGGRFDNQATRFQESPAFGLADHEKGHPVFNTEKRIAEFALQ